MRDEESQKQKNSEGMRRGVWQATTAEHRVCIKISQQMLSSKAMIK